MVQLFYIYGKMWKKIWNDCDLISRISSQPNQPKITLIPNDNESLKSNNLEFIGRKSLQEELNHVLKPHYGFNFQFYDYFTVYSRESLAAEMLQLPNPDRTPMLKRRTLRMKSEMLKWNIDRYLGDLHLFDDPIYNEAMNMIPHWNSIDSITNSLQNITTNESQYTIKNQRESYFTPKEAQKLSSLTIPSIRQPLVQEYYPILLSLVDILYAYTYDHRLTQGDPTCESAWTVTILSMTLSWFECYSIEITPLNVFQWSIRRVLIYPYIRNYEFSIQLVHDVMDILKQGKCCIIRSLLQIYDILEKSECFYIENKLYIGPYILWIQSIDEEIIKDFATSVDKLIKGGNLLGKNTLGLGLQEIEKNILKNGKLNLKDVVKKKLFTL